MAFLTRLLNAVGLHTQAELDAARSAGASDTASAKNSAETATRSKAPQNAAEAKSEAKVEEAGFTNIEARHIFERVTEGFSDLPVAMQVQVKSQAIEKLRVLVTKGRLDVSEFERWKRRLLTL